MLDTAELYDDGNDDDIDDDIDDEDGCSCSVLIVIIGIC